MKKRKSKEIIPELIPITSEPLAVKRAVRQEIVEKTKEFEARGGYIKHLPPLSDPHGGRVSYQDLIDEFEED